MFSCMPLAYQDYMKGLEQNENLNYSEAVKSFLKSWESSPEPETARGLAYAYYKIRNFQQAEEWYSKLNRDSNLDSMDLLPYVETLVANSKYAEAKEILNELDPDKSIQDIKPLWETITRGKDFLNTSTEAQVESVLGINSSFSEFGPFLSDNGVLYFTSDRRDSVPVNINNMNALKSSGYGWTGNGFLSIYSSEWDKEMKEIKSLPIKDQNLNGKLHSGPFFLSGENIFLTLTKPKKFEKTSKGTSRDFTLFPEIFFGKQSDSLDINAFLPLSFNNGFEYSVSDPFYNYKEKKLYFSSDMPGGHGMADLYYVIWSKETGWSEPVNLGSEINTIRNERTPFIDKNGNLYFSSDGYPGLGGLDIFLAEGKGDVFSKPQNLGSPINSNRDDFGFFLAETDKDLAFLASDRIGGNGLDDIYKVNLNVVKNLVLKGKVLDRATGIELKDAVVKLFSKSGNIVESYISGEDGTFSFNVTENQVFSLEVNKTEYFDAFLSGIQIPSNLKKEDSVVFRNVYLDKIEIGRILKLENIYYDFDEWHIREDAKPSLNNLAEILLDNPTMSIELHSHTDSRGASNYNLKLSNRRAKAAVEYLINLGISESRLKPIGFGETEILNNCVDGVKCSEEDHQFNRRTEFKIISY